MSTSKKPINVKKRKIVCHDANGSSKIAPPVIGASPFSSRIHRFGRTRFIPCNRQRCVYGKRAF
jgi:hypothetical protein